MKQAERDNEQLGIIVKYCERIEAPSDTSGTTLSSSQHASHTRTVARYVSFRLAKQLGAFQTNIVTSIPKLTGAQSMACAVTLCMDTTTSMQKSPGTQWKITCPHYARFAKSDFSNELPGKLHLLAFSRK